MENSFPSNDWDVGMSPHEKGEQKDKTESHSTPSLDLCFLKKPRYNELCTFLGEDIIIHKQNKDVGMGLNDFLSLCRHLSVRHLFLR